MSSPQRLDWLTKNLGLYRQIAGTTRPAEVFELAASEHEAWMRLFKAYLAVEHPELQAPFEKAVGDSVKYRKYPASFNFGQKAINSSYGDEFAAFGAEIDGLQVDPSVVDWVTEQGPTEPAVKLLSAVIVAWRKHVKREVFTFLERLNAVPGEAGWTTQEAAISTLTASLEMAAQAEGDVDRLVKIVNGGETGRRSLTGEEIAEIRWVGDVEDFFASQVAVAAAVKKSGEMYVDWARDYAAKTIDSNFPAAFPVLNAILLGFDTLITVCRSAVAVSSAALDATVVGIPLGVTVEAVNSGLGMLNEVVQSLIRSRIAREAAHDIDEVRAHLGATYEREGARAIDQLDTAESAAGVVGGVAAQVTSVIRGYAEADAPGLTKDTGIHAENAIPYLGEIGAALGIVVKWVDSFNPKVLTPGPGRDYLVSVLDAALKLHHGGSPGEIEIESVDDNWNVKFKVGATAMIYDGTDFTYPDRPVDRGFRAAVSSWLKVNNDLPVVGRYLLAHPDKVKAMQSDTTASVDDIISEESVTRRNADSSDYYLLEGLARKGTNDDWCKIKFRLYPEGVTSLVETTATDVDVEIPEDWTTVFTEVPSDVGPPSDGLEASSHEPGAMYTRGMQNEYYFAETASRPSDSDLQAMEDAIDAHVTSFGPLEHSRYFEISLAAGHWCVAIAPDDLQHVIWPEHEQN